MIPAFITVNRGIKFKDEKNIADRWLIPNHPLHSVALRKENLYTGPEGETEPAAPFRLEFSLPKLNKVRIPNGKTARYR